MGLLSLLGALQVAIDFIDPALALGFQCFAPRAVLLDDFGVPALVVVSHHRCAKNALTRNCCYIGLKLGIDPAEALVNVAVDVLPLKACGLVAHTASAHAHGDEQRLFHGQQRSQQLLAHRRHGRLDPLLLVEHLGAQRLLLVLVGRKVGQHVLQLLEPAFLHGLAQLRSLTLIERAFAFAPQHVGSDTAQVAFVARVGDPRQGDNPSLVVIFQVVTARTEQLLRAPHILRVGRKQRHGLRDRTHPKEVLGHLGLDVGIHVERVELPPDRFEVGPAGVLADHLVQIGIAHAVLLHVAAIDRPLAKGSRPGAEQPALRQHARLNGIEHAVA